MKKLTYITIIFLSFIFLLTSVVNIFLSNRVATESITVAELENEIEDIEEENRHLKSKVLALQSLSRISSRAAELGLVENKENIISLDNSYPIASR